nr:hypothetical protein [Panacagrimonas sp.]
MQNPKFSDTDRDAYKALFPNLEERLPNTFSGFDFNFKYGNFADLTPEMKKEKLEEFWNEGTLVLWLASFPDMFTNEGRQRGALGGRAPEDARAPEGPGAVPQADSDDLRLRHAPRAARVGLSRGVSPTQRGGREQSDRRSRARRHEAWSPNWPAAFRTGRSRACST